MKILLVDDNKENLYMLGTLLRDNGYEVEFAADGLEALEKALQDEFDMIISDIMMPRMDGVQLCRKIKTNERLRRLAFVFYTAAYTDPKDEEFALSLGAEKFIIKPQKPDAFIEILSEIIRSHESGMLVAPKLPVEEEAVYLKEYNGRLIKKLEDEVLQLERKNRYETIIRTVTQGVHRSIELQEVLENAVESMSKNIDRVENISIYLVEGEEAILKAYRGYSDWWVKRVGRIPYPKGFTWKTIIEGKPRYCPDVDQDTFIGPAGREVGTRSYLSMPIRNEGKTVGVININSLKKNAFDEEELKLLEIVAQQIEVAINNAQIAEALRQSEESYRTAKDELEIKVKDLEVLTGLIRAVHESTSLDEIYSVALDSVIELENIDMVMTYLVDEERHEAVLQAHRNIPEDYIRRAARIPYSMGATWKVINSGKILNIENAQKDPDIGPAGRDLGHYGVLGIPITLEGRVIGVIWLLSYKERKFGVREINLLSTLGNQIGVAIAKAKLYKDSIKRREQIELVYELSKTLNMDLSLDVVLNKIVESARELG